MEDYLKIFRFNPAKTLSKKQQIAISETLRNIDGITKAEACSSFILIEFNPFLISEPEIKNTIIAKDIVEKLTVKHYSPFKRWIYKLAESNTKNIGNQKLDCCNFNN